MTTLYGIRHDMFVDDSDLPDSSMQETLYPTVTDVTAEAAMMADAIRQDLADNDTTGDFSPYRVEETAMGNGLMMYEVSNCNGYVTDTVSVCSFTLKD